MVFFTYVAYFLFPFFTFSVEFNARVNEEKTSMLSGKNLGRFINRHSTFSTVEFDARVNEENRLKVQKNLGRFSNIHSTFSILKKEKRV